MAFTKFADAEKAEAVKKDELENSTKTAAKPKLASLQPSKV